MNSKLPVFCSHITVSVEYSVWLYVGMYGYWVICSRESCGEMRVVRPSSVAINAQWWSPSLMMGGPALRCVVLMFYYWEPSMRNIPFTWWILLRYPWNSLNYLLQLFFDIVVDVECFRVLMSWRKGKTFPEIIKSLNRVPWYLHVDASLHLISRDL